MKRLKKKALNILHLAGVGLGVKAYVKWLWAFPAKLEAFWALAIFGLIVFLLIRK